jgi:hypothetical protein
MRYLLLSAFLFCFPGVGTSQLASLPEEATVEEFDEALDEFMTATKNERARDAYADFSGILFGGGLTTEQQRRIARSSSRLAAEKVGADRTMAPFLLVHEYLAGSEEERQTLFGQFHDMVDSVLLERPFSKTSATEVMEHALSYLERGRLDAKDGIHGWQVAGGKPTFAYEGVPLLIVEEIERLKGSTKGDSLMILETKVILDLSSGLARGKGGKTDWQRVGLPSDIYVRLVDYEFDVARQLIVSDSAHFQYPNYFGDRILYGSFKDRLQSGGPRVNGDIPEFVSSDGYVDIDNVGEGMTLSGQFELRASRVYVVGQQGRRAVVQLDIADGKDERKLRGRSTQFIVAHQERITGQSVDLAIYFGEDSLYHPSVSIDVDVPAREVTLLRSSSSAAGAPFFHSGNNFNIDADNITVFLARDSAVVGRKTVSFQEKGDVVLESKEYYSERDYSRIQALAGFNPLQVIYNYRHGLATQTDTFNIEGLAYRFGPDLTGADIQGVIFDLQDRGFLQYDPDTGTILVKDKLDHYVLSHREAKDYDKLRLVSSTTVENAFIDLEGGTIRVDAVKPLSLNSKKQIAIRPYADQVSIVGDRNLDFGGTVYAGAAILTGSDFHLKYEPYYIQFDSVDYIDLFLPEGGVIEDGVRRLSTASRLENVSGYVLIDAPKNKSGSEDIGYFPSLQTRGPSYIYYDQADTNSLYSRDSFYFELAPFALNNLDSLTEGDLGLEGELVSGGIFPRMQQTLSVQEDGSLGFIGETDSLGASTYGDRGSYTGQVTLNNGGLKGRGKLDYLEAEIEGEEIVFGVDSTTTVAESFRLERSVTPERSVPAVIGQRVQVTFQPYGDSLSVRPDEGTDFEMFGDENRRFDGRLVLTPEDLRGDGTLDWPAGALTGDTLNFQADGVLARSATIAVKDRENPDEQAVRANGMDGSVDFAAQTASFTRVDSTTETELPYLEYVTSSDRLTWDMDQGLVTFATEPGKDRFTSLQPDQDSLSFAAKSAIYDSNSGELTVGGVPFIVSADAKILPADSSLTINPGAVISQLTNATIVADTASEYHVIRRATVDIAGRKEYTASGFYEYNVGPHEQEFELQNIVGTRVGEGKRSEKATATRAEGEIPEDVPFFIDDRTRFYGTINLDAGSQVLDFEGYAKIESPRLPNADWFSVASEGDKYNLVLSTENIKGIDNKPLYTGIYLSKPERIIYPRLMQAPHRRVDHPILDASGAFVYDEDRDIFYFGDTARIRQPDVRRVGNLMAFDHGAGTFSGEGELGIGGRLKYIRMRSYGTVDMDLPPQFAAMQVEDSPEGSSVTIEDDSPDPAADTTAAEAETLTDNMFLLEEETQPPLPVEEEEATDPSAAPVVSNYPPATVNIMAAIDLILPEPLIEIMATDLISGSYAAPGLGVNATVPFTTAGVETLFPQGPEREAALAGLPTGNLDLPPTINRHTFLFSDIKMQWNQEYQSFVSTETMNGLATIGGRPFSKRVASYLEVKMTTGGEDRLYLYIKSPSESYYFFGFKDGILNVVSNNARFMDEFRDTNPREMVLEMDDGRTYEILEVTTGTASTFLRRMQTAFPENAQN